MSTISVQTPLYKVKVQTKDKVEQPKIKGIREQPKTKVNNKTSGPTKYATTKKNHDSMSKQRTILRSTRRPLTIYSKTTTKKRT